MTLEKIREIFTNSNNEWKIIYDEMERGCFKTAHQLYNRLFSETCAVEKEVLRILNEYGGELAELLNTFPKPEDYRAKDYGGIVGFANLFGRLKHDCKEWKLSFEKKVAELLEVKV